MYFLIILSNQIFCHLGNFFLNLGILLSNEKKNLRISPIRATYYLTSFFSDNSTVSWSNWHDNQPNNDGNCARIDLFGENIHYGWLDGSCIYQNNVICEKSVL